MPPFVVVGSFAFLGFDGLFAVAVGDDVAGAGAAAAGLGLAPPVEAAEVCVGAAAAVADDVAVEVGADAAVLAGFLAWWAGLCCLACRALCDALAVVAAVVGVLVAAAGAALVVDFVDPPPPQPAVTTATAATVQSRPRFISPDSPLSVERVGPRLQPVSDYKGSQPLHTASGARGSYKLTAALHGCGRSGARSQGKRAWLTYTGR